MSKYGNNGFYEYLRRNKGNHNILFYDLKKSLLVVADKNDKEPLMLLIDDRVNKEAYNGLLTDDEKAFGNIAFILARKAKLPIFWIRYYDRSLKNTDEVKIWDLKSRAFNTLELKGIIDIFNGFGIFAKLEKKSPQKEENLYLSSGFHAWQRENMNVGIFTDIDLIRMNEEKTEIIEIIEAKRSHIEAERWKPFSKDYENFMILLKLCKKLGEDTKLSIVYNEYLYEKDYLRNAPYDEKYIFESIKGGCSRYDIVNPLKHYNVIWQACNAPGFSTPVYCEIDEYIK